MQPRPPSLRPQWLGSFSYIALRSSLGLPNRLSHRPNLLSQNVNQQTRTIRSVDGKYPKRSRFNDIPNRGPLTASPEAAHERRLIADTLPLRSGALATKKGMTAVYDPETGKRRTATVLQMDRVQVVANKTRAKHGYFAVCVGEGSRKPKNVGRAMMGVFARTMIGEIINGSDKKNRTKEDNTSNMLENPNVGLSPKREIREFKVRDESGLLPIGTSLTPNWFHIGQYVDARSNTRGHGFAGVMKRHGMKGQPASHGVSLAHRSIGSVGGGQGSGSRVHPGKRMAGRMGNKRHTVQNLEVLTVDNETGIVVIAGPVSGHKGSLVMIQDALRKPWPEVPPVHVTDTQRSPEPAPQEA